jgi:hypothetical protein
MEKLVSTKYIFACDPDYCDCLIELTTSDKFGFPSSVTNITCPCGRVLEPLSVVPDTINPINQPVQKEEKMETATQYNPDLLVTYKKVAGTYASPESPEYITEKVTSIEWGLNQGNIANNRNIELNNKVFKLENVLTTYSEDASEETLEVIKEVANIFDIELTKEIEVTGTMSFTATIRVPLTEDYDIESIMNDELQVTSWGGDVDVNDYSVEDVRESY